MTALYTATISLSAFLLFLVQPLVARQLLPLLGGSPAVWNTAMVFFQILLLAGYLYAHLSSRWLGRRGQPWLHISLVALALAVLSISVPRDVPALATEAPTLWLLGALFAAVGLPFFALAANGPLLQRWLSQSDHPDAANPYFLYAASNVGSLLALVVYPTLVEPFVGVAAQGRIWSWGYGLLAGMLMACAATLWRRPRVAALAAAARLSPPGFSQRVRWLAMAFLPSSLLLGCTTYITTDIAPVPLLWVLPLALYLLSFILCFARRPRLYEQSVALLLPSVMILSIAFLSPGVGGSTSFMPVHWAVLFMASMMCHGYLARDRPGAEHLTEFYLWLSAGGALGGIFNGLVAPWLFDRLWEYPLTLCAVALAHPAMREAISRRRLARNDWIPPVVIAGALVLLAWVLPAAPARVLAPLDPLVKTLGSWWGAESAISLIAQILLITACACSLQRPLRFAPFLAMILVLGVYQPFENARRTVAIERNFFGQIEIVENLDRSVRSMRHGTTLHGLQLLAPELERTPTAYFHRRGPLGDVFATLDSQTASEPGAIGIVGLGTGTIACLVASRPVVFFEIDPAVVRFARDPEYFRFLHLCTPKAEVVLGDARLSLARTPDERFVTLIIDAFSSDAVPVHLLTREAFELYRRKLVPGGALVFHLSSRHLELRQVLGSQAAALGWQGVWRLQAKVQTPGVEYPSEWAFLSARGELVTDLVARHPDWQPLPTPTRRSSWTDDFSNLITLLR